MANVGSKCTATALTPVSLIGVRTHPGEAMQHTSYLLRSGDPTRGGNGHPLQGLCSLINPALGQKPGPGLLSFFALGDAFEGLQAVG